MPPYGCVEQGLEYIIFYVKKYIEYLVACSGPRAGSRRAARGTQISETRLLSIG